MGILKSLGQFFFGKEPDIFDNQGRVLHKFPEDKWKAWDDRLKANPTYDWRNHSAKELAHREKKSDKPQN